MSAADYPKIHMTLSIILFWVFVIPCQTALYQSTKNVNLLMAPGYDYYELRGSPKGWRAIIAASNAVMFQPGKYEALNYAIKSWTHNYLHVYIL